jgi:hypothetical protein
MKQMGVKVAFLPLGVSDPAKNPEMRAADISRLKEVGKMAEKEGVVIGIGTSLDAKRTSGFVERYRLAGYKKLFQLPGRVG